MTNNCTGIVNVISPYIAPSMVSCNWPVNPTVGVATTMTVIINGGSSTETHSIMFSGAVTGTSDIFTVQANIQNQSFTITLTFPIAGSGQSCTATLI